MIPENKFAGDKKVDRSILGAAESDFQDFVVPRIPKSIETYHLTLLTIPFSALVVFFSYLARYDMQWLWGVSALIVLQYLSDLFDGALGRYRNTGLVKWGYYMDHFLDYTFLCAILIGYSFIVPPHLKFLQFFILAVCGGFMVNAYLDFAATNEFRISHLGIGPTEVRIIFIIVNTLLIFFGRTYLAGALPYALGVATIGLWYVVFKTQQRLWRTDMNRKLDDRPK